MSIPHVGTLPSPEQRARHAALRTAEVREASGKVWKALTPTARLVLVMIGAEQAGDVQKIALQDWNSFSQADRESMAAVKRALGREFHESRALT